MLRNRAIARVCEAERMHVLLSVMNSELTGFQQTDTIASLKAEFTQ